MVLDYEISAHKYPKIIPQEKKKNTPRSHQFSEIKGFAKIYLTKGIRLKKNHPLLPPPHAPLPLTWGGGGGGGALLISLPSINCIGLSEYFKIFGVQGTLSSLFLPCVNA